jgi:methylaspartate ammonia-lyase
MTRIQSVVLSAGRTGFYFDDQRAIKAGAGHDGFFYQGDPVTKGFSAIRQAGESISIMLVLDDGQVALGDCAAIQYSGAGGRDPIFLAEPFLRVLRDRVTPLLEGRALTSFREMAGEMDAVEVEHHRLHTALQYGLSQALLDAVARSRHLLPCEVIAEEYNTTVSTKPIPIFAQSGDDRYKCVDKMILKGVDVLPHALINTVHGKLGPRGEKLHMYVEWLRKRILEKRVSEDYSPHLHIDVYGTIGMAFDHDVERMGVYLGSLAEVAAPFSLRIEGPVDMGERTAQCEMLGLLRAWLRERGIPVGLVVDEWCNTMDDVRYFAENQAADMIQIKTPVLGGIQNSIEGILYCKQHNLGAYLGGTCNETDRSAQMCVHAALATQPDQMLAKPGMGMDEGFMIVYNEMRRALALLAAKRGAKQ